MKNNSGKFDVLVTDASQRVALEITRLLGKSGLKILTVEREPLKRLRLASFSRYCSSFESVSDYNNSKFLTLCEKVKTVIPVSTNTILAVMDVAAKKYPEKFLLPEKYLFKKVNNKLEITEVARVCGVLYPETKIIRKDQPLCWMKSIENYPLVLKLPEDEGLYLEPSQRYAIVNSKIELETAYQKLVSYKKDILMQEYIDGDAYGWSALYNRKHHCIAHISHKRLREYPISGGPSTFCVSVNEPELEKAGRKILDFLKWIGPAMVEFKRDRKDGKFKILEINPRYWGSLPLARYSGLNFLTMHYMALCNKKINKKNTYLENKKLKFHAMDIMAAKDEFKTTKNKLGFLVRYIFETLNPRIADGIWMWNDPIPPLVYFIQKIW